MATLQSILEVVGAFLVGLAGRFGFFLLMAAVLVVPALIWGLVVHALRTRRAPALTRAEGLGVRPGAFHAPNHTWLASERPGELQVGLDDLAQRLMPSVTALDLPRPGMAVHRGDPVAVLRAGGYTVQLGSPIDGMVVRVNRKVEGDPGLVKRENYGDGWLFSIAPANDAYSRYPRDGDAAGWMRAERQRLERFLETELDLAAADGGELPAPTPAALGEDGWRKVVFAFMRES